MPDTTIYAGGESPEQVAYKLLGLVAQAEGQKLANAPTGKVPERKWILDTYAECLRAVKGLPAKKAP
jgi:hypothetical protein